MFAFASESPLEGLARVTREINALEAERIRLAFEYEKSGVWTNKYRNAACGIADACHVTEGAARVLLDLAHALEELPKTSDAFANGDIPKRAAERIAKAATPERRDDLLEEEEELVRAAQKETARPFDDRVKSITDRIDGDNGIADDERMFNARGFDLAKKPDGMTTPSGGFDPESSEVISTALDFEMERDFAKGDPRSVAQRRADALRNICQWFLDHHADKPAKRSQPHVLLVHDLEQMGVDGELRAAARTEAVHSGRLSQATLERIMCDCTTTDVITDGVGCVLNVGRKSRGPTEAQWNALVVRDRGCVECGRAPRYCQAHHKRYWERGGPTDLDNLELRCWHCHREVHANDERVDRVLGKPIDISRDA